MSKIKIDWKICLVLLNIFQISELCRDRTSESIYPQNVEMLQVNMNFSTSAGITFSSTQFTNFLSFWTDAIFRTSKLIFEISNGNTKWSSSRKKMNKMIKIVNGNGQKSFEVMHWNLGAKKWQNKIEEIQALVDEFKPDFCFFSEANLAANLPDYEINIQGYEINTPKSHINLNFSRLVLLSKEGAKFKIEWNRMNTEVASIWISIGGRGKKATLIGGIYREFTQLHDGAPPNSGDMTSQIARWKQFIQQWKQAAEIDSCWIIGDLNVDVMKWNEPNYENEELVNLIKDDIETENFSQLIKKPTRFWTGTQSLLDHIWTNSPEKMLSIKNTDRAASDHNVISVKIRTKGSDRSQNEIKIRDKKNFDAKNFKNEVSMIDWTELYKMEDLNLANDFFSTKIATILEKMAPMKKIQIRNKITPWVTSATKNLMGERDKTRNRATVTNSPEDWTEYRSIRNKCSAEVKKDKNKFFRNQFENFESENDLKSIYTQVKKNLGWKKTGPPASFRTENGIERRPKILANLQNDFYTNKVKELEKKTACYPM